jgi:UDP-N-acetylmuramate dehydrogenase
MNVVAKPVSDERELWRSLRAACRDIRRDEPMSKHTTIGAGGPVRFLATPKSPREIVALVRAASSHRVPYIGMGRGSNLVVRDGGYDGLVIRVASNVADLELRARTCYAEAGVSFTRLGRILTNAGRPGFEFAIGIPGSVGGAVRMNAGAYGSELSKVLKSARIVDGDGRVAILKPGELHFRYRHSSLPKGSIVLSALFHCPPGVIDEERLKRSLGRKETQPLSQRSFGSTFKNPPGRFAAQMIEACGLKGFRKGGVMISEKHSNFIVNVGENTLANDVEDLIGIVIEKVQDKFGVTLKPEVVIIGNR